MTYLSEAETQYTICKYAKFQNTFSKCHEKFIGQICNMEYIHLYFMAGTEKKGYLGIQGSWCVIFDIDTSVRFQTIFISTLSPLLISFWIFLSSFFVFFARFFFPFLVFPFPRFLDPLAFFRPLLLIFLILLHIFFTSSADFAMSLKHFFNQQQHFSENSPEICSGPVWPILKILKSMKI